MAVKVRVQWCHEMQANNRVFTKDQYGVETDDEFADRIAAALKENKPDNSCTPPYPS